VKVTYSLESYKKIYHIILLTPSLGFSYSNNPETEKRSVYVHSISMGKLTKVASQTHGDAFRATGTTI